MPEQTIICGNALEILKTFPDESFDCIVTDPPYKLGTSSVKVNADGTINDKKRKRWIKKNADEDNQALIETGQMIQNIPKFEEWLLEVYRVLKNGCHAYVMINGRNFAELQTKAEKVGFKFQNDLTWLKQNATPNKFYMKSTERILMLHKGKERYINDMGASDVFYVKNPVGKKLHITEKPAELTNCLTSCRFAREYGSYKNCPNFDWKQENGDKYEIIINRNGNIQAVYEIQ